MADDLEDRRWLRDLFHTLGERYPDLKTPEAQARLMAELEKPHPVAKRGGPKVYTEQTEPYSLTIRNPAGAVQCAGARHRPAGEKPHGGHCRRAEAVARARGRHRAPCPALTTTSGESLEGEGEKSEGVSRENKPRHRGLSLTGT